MDREVEIDKGSNKDLDWYETLHEDEKYITYIEHGFQFESEVLIKILSNNGTIDHIEIPTIYTQENSSINNILDTFKFIRLILRYLIRV